MKMALRMSLVLPIVTVLFVLYLFIYSTILVRMAMRHEINMDNFLRFMNETHLDLSFLKLPEKTEYKTPLKVNNGGTESLNQSQFRLVSFASAHPPSDSPTSFERMRKWKLKVNNGGTDMPESLNHSPVHLISLESVSPTPPPMLPPAAFRPPTPPLSITVLSPPPPPSLSERQIQQQQVNNILEALIGAGNFVGWANLLASANLSSLPLTATFFIPGNEAMSNHQTFRVQNLDPSLIAYHIIPQRLPFSDLVQLKLNSRIPTLLPSKFIVVTNNSLSNFTIDGSQIAYPDLYVNPTFTVHGVDKILEYSVYDAEPLLSPPIKSPRMADADAPSPPLKPKSMFPSLFPVRGRDFIDDSDSNIPFATEKLIVLLSVSIFLLQ